LTAAGATGLSVHHQIDRPRPLQAGHLQPANDNAMANAGQVERPVQSCALTPVIGKSWLTASIDCPENLHRIWIEPSKDQSMQNTCWHCAA